MPPSTVDQLAAFLADDHAAPDPSGAAEPARTETARPSRDGRELAPIAPGRDGVQLALGMEPDTGPVTVTPGDRESDHPHRHTPAVKGLQPGDVAAVLDLAEDALRYNQTPRSILNTNDKTGAGGNGPVGAGPVMLDHTGARIRDADEEPRTAKWPAILRALEERREQEPETARARDLAHAYRMLRHFSTCYGPGTEHASPTLIGNIAAEVRQLGGDVAAVLPDYREDEHRTAAGTMERWVWGGAEDAGASVLVGFYAIPPDGSDPVLVVGTYRDENHDVQQLTERRNGAPGPILAARDTGHWGPLWARGWTRQKEDA